MTTHLRARALQAGALVALVSGMLFVAASPAQAARPGVEITNVSSTNIATGEKTTLKYRVTNNNPGATSVRIQVSGMSCANDCSPVVTLPPGNGGAREFTATLTAPQVDAGDSESVQVQVSATVNNETATATETIEVRGPDKPQTVRQISGRVRDLNGKAISGAQVFMQDSADHKYETTSNNSGAYSFTSSDDKPITPGQVSIGAGKEGFKAAAISVNAAAGKTVSAPSLNLSPTAATPSATPSATEGASSPPVDDATDETTDPADQTAAATDPASGDSGSSSMLFIILGGLLVAAGVGAIVLVLMRRKGNDDDDADGPGGVIPPSQGGGRYGDATRVAAPVGARPNDATMVASMSGAPSISDAPTMLQRPVPADDEFPDPYGAPVQLAHGGYSAAAASTYGAGAQVPVQGGYDDEYAGPATQYGRAVQPHEEQYDGFMPPAADQRYDEQTGMYRPEPAYEQPAGYDAGGYRREPTAAGGYQGAYGQPQPGGYGPQPQPEPGYGSWEAPDGGAETGNAYGPAAGGGAYGGRAQASGGGAYGGRGQASGGGAYGGGAPVPGGAGGYAAPAGSGTYGAAQGGYGVPARSGTYGGAPSYGDQDGADYGGDQGGYDPRATYGRPDGYEQPPSRGAQQGGYGAPAGYPQTGYPQTGYEQGGYDQGRYDQGGYEQQGGGRHGGPARPEPTPPPGKRRPVDWLDD